MVQRLPTRPSATDCQREAREAYQAMIGCFMHEFQESLGRLESRATLADQLTHKKMQELVGSLRRQQQVIQRKLLSLVKKEAWADFHHTLKIVAEDFRGKVDQVEVSGQP